MVLIDSSVRVAHLRNHNTATTAKLTVAINRETLLVGDLILLEVLRGARHEAHSARIESGSRQHTVVPVLEADLAIRAARNDRLLRAIAATLSKMADIIIGTFCIENGHGLLHDDRDLAPLEQNLGLMVA